MNKLLEHVGVLKIIHEVLREGPPQRGFELQGFMSRFLARAGSERHELGTWSQNDFRPIASFLGFSLGATKAGSQYRRLIGCQYHFQAYSRYMILHLCLEYGP